MTEQLPLKEEELAWAGETLKRAEEKLKKVSGGPMDSGEA